MVSLAWVAGLEPAFQAAPWAKRPPFFVLRYTHPMGRVRPMVT